MYQFFILVSGVRKKNNMLVYIKQLQKGQDPRYSYVQNHISLES